MNNYKRSSWIDMVRTAAILCVILCHVSDSIYMIYTYSLPDQTILSEVFGFTAFTIGRLGVPFFLFISGYLLLNHDYNAEQTYSFWKTHLLRLLLVVEIWTIFYSIFETLYKHIPFHLPTLMKQMLFLHPSGLSHMWYMPMLLGLYLFLPFIANVINHVDLKLLRLPVILLFLYLFFLPILNVFLRLSRHTELVALPTPGFECSYYGFYLIFGVLVRKKALFKPSAFALAGLGTVSFLCCIGLQIFSYHAGAPYNVWYDNALLFICTLALFMLAARTEVKHFAHIFYQGARYSFGIYLIHNPILIVLLPHLEWISFFPVRVIIAFLCTTILSFIIVFFISLIPVIGKKLLYIK